MSTIPNLRRAALPALAMALAAAPAVTPAQTAAPLTLREAVERALGTYPAVAAARADRVAAGHDLAAAEAARQPTVQAAAGGIYHDLPAVATPIHGFTPGEFPEFDRTTFQGTLTLDYLLTDGGVRAGRIRQAVAQAAAADAALTGAQQTTAAQVAAAYLQVLTGEETLDAHRRRIAALEAERDRVKLRFEAGRAAEVEVRRIEASLAAAEADRVAIESGLDTSRSDLFRLIGQSATTGGLPHTDVPDLADLSGGLEPVALADHTLPDRDGLMVAASAASPEVMAATQALAAAEAAVTVARAARRPKLHAVANGLEYGAGSGTFQTEWNAGLQFAVPIYTAGADGERAARAEAARDAAAERLRLALLGVGERVDRALAAAREAGARADALAEAVASFTEVARIELLRVDAGAGTQTDYLAAEADLLAARARLVEARNGEIAARVELARAAGLLDLAWFERSIAPEAQP